MSRPGLVLAPILFALAVCVSSASAQTPLDRPRLTDGRPDLQGVWDGLGRLFRRCLRVLLPGNQTNGRLKDIDGTLEEGL